MQHNKSAPTFFGHPFQLSTLFHIELWERFSFYGMQAILIFYLYFEASKGGLGFDKAEAGSIVGIYGGSVYLATLLGGWLADRVLGTERTLFYSGIVVMLGHLSLAFLPALSGLVIGLSLIALGSGGVKSASNAMVGSLYESPETRKLRDAGFSIFYLAINIGGFVGPLVVATLQDEFGFHYGFGAAAIGMALGLWQYGRGRKKLPETPVLNPLKSLEKLIVAGGAIAVIVAVAALFHSGLLNYANFKNVLIYVVVALIILYFVRLLLDGKALGANQNYIIAYIPLFLASCIFWAVWFQVYTIVPVYFESVMDRHVGTYIIPEGWLASAQSFWVIALASAMAAMWMKMGNKQPKAPLKYAMALILVGLSYAIFIPYTANNVVMPLLMILVHLLVLTIAELCISPISLSFATKIAPTRFKSQMVALNFLSLSVGFAAGGKWFGAAFDEKNYTPFFQQLTIVGVIAGAVLLLLIPVLNRLLKGVD